MKNSYTKPNLKTKYFEDLFNSLPSMENKSVAITGTTSGLGFYAAESVAKLGARVLLLNRPSDRAETSYALLNDNCSNGDLHKVDCDLQSFESVKSASLKVSEICTDGLDVLCNNAGVMALKDKATIDGFDVQMQTNHLSHFLLTKLCMPLLDKASQLRNEARIVNHSSIARTQAKKLKEKFFEKKGGNLGGDKGSMIFGTGRWERYAQTKLANAAFTACLHEKLKNKNPKIKAMVAHPGLAESDLQSTTVEDGGLGSLFTKYMMKFGQSEKDGTLGLLRCIADPKINSGSIVGPGLKGAKGKAKSFPLESFYDNEETKNLLWTKSCEAISENFEI